MDGLFEAFEGVKEDTLPRGRAQEMASLAGAIVKLYEAAEMDAEIRELRDIVADLRERAS